MFDYLQTLGVKNLVGVPDSTMKHFIDQGLKKNKILIATREEEAIGIAVGMSLSKNHTLVFMQNAGLANSISTITSLVQLYQIPLIFLVGWRGYLQNDAPEHKKIGEIQSDILKLIGLKSKIVKDDNWKSCCKWALKQISNGSSCCLVIQRLF
ncbi:uncharacterized protein METZ01_LOCUS202632 [marine metagenome]|uniref:Thiamine pyrophosphate enzyme N-terminal TPP-binding domain-containing protein n=1 Tax=marine metagenome TaxID=408172 RepID=A0A382EGC6_9ZZZZ